MLNNDNIKNSTSFTCWKACIRRRNTLFQLCYQTWCNAIVHSTMEHLVPLPYSTRPCFIIWHYKQQRFMHGECVSSDSTGPENLFHSAGSPFSRSESVRTLSHPSSYADFRPLLTGTADMFSRGQTTGINTPHRTHAAEIQHIYHTGTPSIQFKKHLIELRVCRSVPINVF